MSHLAELKAGGTIIIGREYTVKGKQYYKLADGSGSIRTNKVGRILPNRNNVYSEDLARLRHTLAT